MLNLIWLLLVILPMTNGQKPCSSKDGKPCSWRYFKNVSEGNQALPPSSLISSHNIHRLGECHLLCINQDNCYGLNFRVRPSTVYTVNCQLSNSSVKMNMTKMKNGPWVYYEDVSVTKDVDECAKGTHKCSKRANCTNTPGSYKCQCHGGFKGNGEECSDHDECSEGNFTCHPNATCINTQGSYNCQCKNGYVGDGKKNCSDIDECSERKFTCHVKETCINTQGSYNCQCKQGYEGDGKKNCTVRRKECNSYKLLNNKDRNINYASNGSEWCDDRISTGWYRFDGDAGKQMSTTCRQGGYRSDLKCQTHAVSWLNGRHPTVSEGKVTRTVCFSFRGNYCQEKTDIEVINCGFSYVYKLVPVPRCYLRYCGSHL